MRLTDEQIQSMQEDITADMLYILTENRKMTVQEAMLLLYNSDTYTRLMDVGSGLYYQSPGYVMDCLDNEVTTGRCF